MFNLEKRRFQGGLITGFQYLRGVYKISGEVIFIREYSYRTRGKSFKLKKKKKYPQSVHTGTKAYSQPRVNAAMPLPMWQLWGMAGAHARLL